MSWFPDMGRESMIASGEHVRAIGWLSSDHPYNRGTAPDDFVARLREFARLSGDSTIALDFGAFGGYHVCEFCQEFSGGGNFGVPYGHVLFVAPDMVSHYVEAHGYLPPSDFIAAVMASPLPDTPEYQEAVQQFREIHQREMEEMERRMVKVLLFSDLHCNERAAEEVVKRARKVDVVIGAGDFANARRGIDLCINMLKQIEQPTVLVPGNNESYDELATACRGWSSAHVLHGQSVDISGISFFGIGGGIPVTPFGPWSFDFSEEQAAKLLEGCKERCVLVSHSPPKGYLDLSSSGQHLGSTAVLKAIQNKLPRLVVCGHIHNSAGRHADIGESIVVNAGPRPIEWVVLR